MIQTDKSTIKTIARILTYKLVSNMDFTFQASKFLISYTLQLHYIKK